MTRAERTATDAYRAFYGARSREAGGATVLRVDEAPGSPMLNRAVGLGTTTPATEADVDEILAALEGTTFYVAVSAHAQPPALAGWLTARGLAPGWCWQQFERGVAPPPPAETPLRLREVDDDRSADAFAEAVQRGYELPEATRALLSEVREAPGWTCWVAYEGEEPAGAAALYAADGSGYLGFAATLPEHRRKGSQNALLAARIERARELGCDAVFTETGELRDDRPSNSYRNLLRAGFRETDVVANWLGGSR